MNTPADNMIPKLTPITHDTVGRVPARDEPTAEHKQLLNLDHLFPEKFGQYRVLKELGKGGMGSVFLAEDPVLHRRVAIKTLRAELAMHPVCKERFLREARIVSDLKHEHIVTIYSVGEEYGIPYLAMEFLEGMSLEDVIQKKKKVTPLQIIRLGREIARALAVAHEKDLIHRDIKPGNIWLEMVDRKSGRTRVKILDFGLARYAQQDNGITQAGMVVGTPHYVSPEQARGKELDPRSDLFSLGVVLYRLSTRKFPFDGEDTLSLLTALAIDTPKRMREFNPAISEAFDDFVMQLLEKRPDDRPQSAKIVSMTLQEMYHDEVERSGEIQNSGKLPAVQPVGPFLSTGTDTMKPVPAAPPPGQNHQVYLIILIVLIALCCFTLMTLLFVKLLSN